MTKIRIKIKILILVSMNFKISHLWNVIDWMNINSYICRIIRISCSITTNPTKTSVTVSIVVGKKIKTSQFILIYFLIFINKLAWNSKSSILRIFNYFDSMKIMSKCVIKMCIKSRITKVKLIIFASFYMKVCHKWLIIARNYFNYYLSWICWSILGVWSNSTEICCANPVKLRSV